MGTLPSSTPRNIYIPDADEIFSDSGLNRAAHLVWGSPEDAVAEIGRWIEEETRDFEDDTNRTGIYEFYVGDSEASELSNALKTRIKKAISERVKVRCYAKALAVQPANIGWENLWKQAKTNAQYMTTNLIYVEPDGTTHEDMITWPDRFPKALGPTNVDNSVARTDTDGKDRLVFDDTVQEGD